MCLATSQIANAHAHAHTYTHAYPPSVPSHLLSHHLELLLSSPAWQALKKLRVDFVRKHGKNGWKLTVAQQVTNLRARAANGKAAIGVFERAERQEAALGELVAQVEGSIEVALGILLTKRRINVHRARAQTHHTASQPT